MKGYIKAAYIYWLLPQPVKSRCLTALDSKQQATLNKGLQHITSLSIQQEISILKEAIDIINAIKIHTKHIRDISIIASCIIFGIIIILSALVSSGWHVVDSMYYILQYGGLHAVLVPFIMMYAGKLMRKPFFQLVKPSHIILDILMAIIAATAIVIIFSFIFPHNTVPVTKLSIIASIFAITAVPLSEELFSGGSSFCTVGNTTGILLHGFLLHLYLQPFTCPTHRWNLQHILCSAVCYVLLHTDFLCLQASLHTCCQMVYFFFYNKLITIP